VRCYPLWRFMRRLFPAALVLACTGVASHASAHKPLSPRAFWSGLDPATDHAPSQGVRSLRPTLAGRVRVPGGTFAMGSTREDLERAQELCHHEMLESDCNDARALFLAETHPHGVTIASFELDRTEVTVAEYARCVAAETCQPPGFTPGDPRYDQPEFPVTYVRWEDAAAYCSWSGARLPTEAEWELAARGPTGRQFPWGNVYNPHLCNHGALAPDTTDATDGFAGLAPVGSFPDGATPLGILDLAGNAAEYVSDFFELSDDGGFGYPPTPQVNPKGPKTGIFHVVRGGSYLAGAPWVRSMARGPRGAPTEALGLARSPSVGFRCAADAS
jgi:formylglycine-generating enzyme required for sulfatase activity